jgi:hypothetical protein
MFACERKKYVTHTHTHMRTHTHMHTHHMQLHSFTACVDVRERNGRNVLQHTILVMWMGLFACIHTIIKNWFAVCERGESV